jgi:uncharacterized protein with HEPN domain
VSDDRVYLLHARDAIDAILDYTADGRDGFFADRKTQDAVVRNIEILGQAVKGLSDGTRALDATIAWRQIAGMRDKLIHEYFGVDLSLVWDVVERELPQLRPRIENLIMQLGACLSNRNRGGKRRFRGYKNVSEGPRRAAEGLTTRLFHRQPITSAPLA